MTNKDPWKVAVDIKAREAEEKFQRGEKLDQDDIVAMALAHPDKFDIQVGLRK